MRRKREHEEEAIHCTLIAMIDVVFQLIIFFVCTVSMQEKARNDRIVLASAPNGKVAVKDPREITVDVDRDGRISIARTQISENMLFTIVKKAMADTGSSEIPVLIRADGGTKHGAVKRAMDACSKAGIWKIKFVAIKESASGARRRSG